MSAMSEILSAIENSEKRFKAGTAKQYSAALIHTGVICKKNKNVIISALQEQIERKKGCEWCNGDALKNVALTTTWGTPKIALHSGEELTESEKFKFCPNCGRDLRKPVNPNE